MGCEESLTSYMAFCCCGSIAVSIDGIEQQSGYTVDYEVGRIIFDAPPAMGAVITADCAYWLTLFHGYPRRLNSADTERQTISCLCRDLSKRLQDTYIEQVRGVRVYGRHSCGRGYPANHRRQTLGEGTVTVYCPNPPGSWLELSSGVPVGLGCHPGCCQADRLVPGVCLGSGKERVPACASGAWPGQGYQHS